MAPNTEPIFLRTPFIITRSLQTGSITPLVLGVQQPIRLVESPEEGSGTIVVDLFLQPCGAISAGFFLRTYLLTPTSGHLISEIAITASSASPFLRQDLSGALAKVLNPTITNAAGKKDATYLAPGTALGFGLSADLASPIVLCAQGGHY